MFGLFIYHLYLAPARLWSRYSKVIVEYTDLTSNLAYEQSPPSNFSFYFSPSIFSSSRTCSLNLQVYRPCSTVDYGLLLLSPHSCHLGHTGFQGVCKPSRHTPPQKQPSPRHVWLHFVIKITKLHVFYGVSEN